MNMYKNFFWMKQSLSLRLTLIIIAISLFLIGKADAQLPYKMSYQAVVRNADNKLVINSPVGMRVSILKGSVDGTAVYSEVHLPAPQTNSNGLVTIEIGSGVPGMGNMSSVDWSAGPFFIKTESDPTGGTNYSIVGVSQLLSVPFAFYAAQSGSSLPGPQGAPGPKGDQGEPGQKGDKGDHGEAGPQGLQGIAGPKGDQGDTGSQGLQGLPGQQGEKGDPGLDGADGSGIHSVVSNGDGTFTLHFTDGTHYTTTNLTGPKGEKGDRGETGPQGEQGPMGISGTRGDKGDRGETGAQGLQGIAGTKGEPGEKGEQGIPGEKGEKGEQGTQGEKGEKGDPGLDGNNGVGIYSAVSNGNGTFSLHFTDGRLYTTPNLTGPKGDKGDTGPQGLQGSPGPKGDQGTQGTQGIQGAKGDTGSQGPQGLPGPQGGKGDPGQDGADGTGIQIARSNENGTFTLYFTDGTHYTTANLTGPKGDMGVTGPRGYQGQQGIPGPKGDKGDTGLQGSQGVPGPKGDKGDKGVRGPQGLQGSVGPKGEQGEQGLPGPEGDKGDTGPHGPQGVPGPKGDKGDQGDKGDKGEPGVAEIPIKTTAEIMELNPQPGMSVINSTDNSFMVHNGNHWVSIPTTAWPQPTAANAGSDQDFNDGRIKTTLTGNAPEENYGSGQWSIVSGTGGSFDDPQKPDAEFTGVLCTQYTLRWTITTSVGTSYDELIVNFTNLPDLANAGPDQVFDDQTLTTTLAANTLAVGTGTWTIISGEGGSFDDPGKPNAIFTATTFGEFEIQWTTTALCASYSDVMKVNFKQYSSFTDERDGRAYKSVKIGNKWWMAENLAYLPSVSPSDVGSETLPYYYVYEYQGTDIDAAKATGYYETYGVLYNFSAASKSPASPDFGGGGGEGGVVNPYVQGVCPAGWHLPGDDEWAQLENYLIANGYNYDGTTNGNKIAKSMAATTYWNLIPFFIDEAEGAIGYNLSQNNKSGFSALPGGYRMNINGSFSGVLIYGIWWSSSSEVDSSNAWYRSLASSSSNLNRDKVHKSSGLSVRCVRD